MKLSDLTVEVRDKTLKRIGVIQPQDLNMSFRLDHNNASSWTLTLPAEHRLGPVLRTPGSGIIVSGPDGVLLSGPVTSPELVASSGDPLGTTTVSGVGDTILLADRLCLPDPMNPNPTTQTKAHDTRVGPAESIMHAFVVWNLGNAAGPVRKNPYLQMGEDLGRGGTTVKSARFDVLATLLADLAAAAKLGFRIVQRDDDLYFETYAVTDRSAEIRLDVLNGTLASRKIAIQAPTATEVIVAGQGDLVARQFYLGTSVEAQEAEVAWGRRIEKFVDQRQTSDVAEFEQKATEVLAKEGFTAIKIQAVPVDDSTMRFGVDWNLGDTISVVAGSFEVQALVTGFILKVDKDGVKIGATLGDIANESQLQQRLDYLEKSGAGDGTGANTAPGSGSGFGSTTLTGIVEIPALADTPTLKRVSFTQDLTVEAQAAKAIYDRLNAGLAVDAGWTWTGSPPFVGQYNEDLQARFVSDGGAVDDLPTAKTWLLTYYNDNGGSGQSRFGSPPVLSVTPVSTTPGTTILGSSANAITKDGADIYVTTNVDKTVRLMWIAIGDAFAPGELGGGDFGGPGDWTFDPWSLDPPVWDPNGLPNGGTNPWPAWGFEDTPLPTFEVGWQDDFNPNLDPFGSTILDQFGLPIGGVFGDALEVEWVEIVHPLSFGNYTLAEVNAVTGSNGPWGYYRMRVKDEFRPYASQWAVSGGNPAHGYGFWIPVDAGVTLSLEDPIFDHRLVNIEIATRESLAQNFYTLSPWIPTQDQMRFAPHTGGEPALWTPYWEAYAGGGVYANLWSGPSNTLSSLDDAVPAYCVIPEDDRFYYIQIRDFGLRDNLVQFQEEDGSYVNTMFQSYFAYDPVFADGQSLLDAIGWRTPSVRLDDADRPINFQTLAWQA